MLKSFLSFQSVQNELTDASASSSKATMDQYSNTFLPKLKLLSITYDIILMHDLKFRIIANLKNLHYTWRYLMSCTNLSSVQTPEVPQTQIGKLGWYYNETKNLH